jgi:hypothetical protein
MAVPYLGSTLAHFIFGPLTELRIKRIEKTLNEITEMVGEEKAKTVNNEQFTNLLESLIPNLSRAVDEEKRQRFRDLLANAAELPSESSGWNEAHLASTLLSEIETPGLAILAGLDRFTREERVTLASLPVPQVFQGEFDYENPGEPQYVLPYEWPVVEYWARWLREKRLITYSSHDARGGFAGVALAELGNFLVKWIVK